MSIFRELTALIRQLFSWWIVISPWEQAVRVRLGKYVRVLKAGIHLRIPFIDLIYRQSTRLRFTDLPVQTITTIDGHTVTLSGTIGYTIVDIKKLYETLHHADDTIMNLAQAALAKAVRKRRLEDCDSEAIEEYVSNDVVLDRYGLGNVQFSLLEFAKVRVFRIIDSQRWSSGDRLNTVPEGQSS